MEQLARDVFPEFVQLMTSEYAYIRKKVCLSLIKIITIVPDLIEGMVRQLPALLVDNDHGVLVSGGTLHPLSFSRSANLLCFVACPRLHSSFPKAGSASLQASAGRFRRREG